MDSLEATIENVFGFIWRWFWRIVIWGVVAFIALACVLYMLSWADEHPDRWPQVFIAVVVALGVGALYDIRRLLARLVDQNATLIQAARKPRIHDYD